MIQHFLFVFLFFVHIEGKGLWHTSQVRLTKLYDLQKQHFNVINDYLGSEIKRLEELEKILASMYLLHQAVTNNVTYIHNHINSILTMNRYSQQIREVEDLINNGNSMAALNAIDVDSDLSGDQIISYSIRGLRRLQRFYNITAPEMVAGKFGDRIIGNEMNACECYVIAEHCFKEYDMGGALDWGVQTYDKWTNSGYPKCVIIENLVSHIVISSVYTGFDYRTLFHQDYPYLENTEKFTQYFSLVSAEINLHVNKTLNIFDSFQSTKYDNADAKFKALCKHGKSNRTLTNDLQCRYQTRNSSYRILLPFKEEDVDAHPYIKIYHDILYDGEIQNIKSLVINKMGDAEVIINHKPTLFEESRSGQISWIGNGAEHVKLINDRIKCLTGLSLKSAESYQMVNYGLGGHYVYHHDAFRKDYPYIEDGNRIATLLFYLSDVPNDGYTVFPMRDIVVPVIKGSAILWYNLDSINGEIIEESFHGSCPILKGNKWIMTKWIREKGQFLSYNWKNNYKLYNNTI